jgi:hypothetical protein
LEAKPEEKKEPEKEPMGAVEYAELQEQMRQGRKPEQEVEDLLTLLSQRTGLTRAQAAAWFAARLREAMEEGGEEKVRKVTKAVEALPTIGPKTARAKDYAVSKAVLESMSEETEERLARVMDRIMPGIMAFKVMRELMKDEDSGGSWRQEMERMEERLMAEIRSLKEKKEVDALREEIQELRKEIEGKRATEPELAIQLRQLEEELGRLRDAVASGRMGREEAREQVLSELDKMMDILDKFGGVAQKLGYEKSETIEGKLSREDKVFRLAKQFLQTFRDIARVPERRPVRQMEVQEQIAQAQAQPAQPQTVQEAPAQAQPEAPPVQEQVQPQQ